MISSGFLLGLVAFLAVPGPTNTLLATAGATDGLASAHRLLAAELAAYLLAITTLGVILSPLIVELPLIGAGLQGAAALYLLLTALRLWRMKTRCAVGPVISWQHIALATVMNPKSLVIAFGLMPEGWSLDGPTALAHLGVIAMVTPLIGGFWMLMGRYGAVGIGSVATSVAPRISAIALGIFAVLLARSALAG
ncbi:hypothetical protein [Rhabdaerophilum sp.]|uniref:hypothetical protein n=1 Tax=Rhabdaerophilum sp. TaxID=2717341 RepID=UPI0038D3864A